MRKTRIAATLGAVALGACTPEPIVLEINFPSEPAFLVTRSVQVHVVSASASDPCGEARRSVIAGSEPAGLLGRVAQTPVCDVRAGIPVPVLGSGPLAYVVTALNDTNTVLFSGCQVADLDTVERIRVVLTSTPAGDRALIDTPPPPGETIMSRCSRGP
jgi:hypothetical protein